ncbi:hypothetical protein [Aureivirga sp. CE67]|uniref:hypothetical protein n=1 Tax=Aureivirga sp. CE67 TaxID=1788983 RepID=UPI0018C99F2B|nr:hypothetical protein [Aureivirga sp. CE67]
MKFLVVIFLILFENSVFSQEYILSTVAIEKKEHSTVKSFEKFTKHPKRNRLKNHFLKDYNRSVSEYEKKLSELNSDAYSEKPWIEILNTLHSLYFLDSLVTSHEQTAYLHSKDYKELIDSVSVEATKNLYEVGNKYLNEKGNVFGSAIAYRNFKKVLEISPGYKNTKDLLDVTILKGKKNVYFAPVQYKNQGNYFEISSDNASVTSNFIIDDLIKNLSINNIGSTFERSKGFETDWVVNMTWNSINIAPERKHTYDIKRNRVIRDGNTDVTVSATVTITETYKTIDGNMTVIVDDVKNNNEISRHNFLGTITHTMKEAKYKGDKRALTYEDNALITESLYRNKVNDIKLIEMLFEQSIYQQFISDLGGLFNWNL